MCDKNVLHRLGSIPAVISMKNPGFPNYQVGEFGTVKE